MGRDDWPDHLLGELQRAATCSFCRRRFPTASLRERTVPGAFIRFAGLGEPPTVLLESGVGMPGMPELAAKRGSPPCRTAAQGLDRDWTVTVGGGQGRIADGLTAARSCQGAPESTS